MSICLDVKDHRLVRIVYNSTRTSVRHPAVAGDAGYTARHRRRRFRGSADMPLVRLSSRLLSRWTGHFHYDAISARALALLAACPAMSSAKITRNLL